MQPESRKLLVDVLQAISDAQSFLKNADRDRFLSDRLLQAGVERELEIMGEALNRLSRQDSHLFQAIENAHKIIGMRNVLAHGYDVIDYRIIWNTAQWDFPPLLAQIEELLR